MKNLPEFITIKSPIDPHTHLRQPSPVNTAETYAKGTEAALNGGYGGICDISNTEKHPTKDFNRVMEKHTIIKNEANIPTGIWLSAQPEDDNIGQIRTAQPWIVGGKFFAHPSTGHDKYLGAEDLRAYATEFMKFAPNLPIALHAGPDNLGEFIDLAEELGFHLYIFHMNKPDDVDLATAAKNRGVRLTRETSPHHLIFSEDEVEYGDWRKRMQPPLAKEADREKLMWQIMVGQIDTIGTDHAPHTIAAKQRAEQENPNGDLDSPVKAFGVRSLSVAPALILTEFIKNAGKTEGFDPVKRFEEVMSIETAKAIGITHSRRTNTTFQMGEREITPDDDIKLPDAAPSPYIGRVVMAKAVSVEINGHPVFADGRVRARYPQVLTRGLIV